MYPRDPQHISENRTTYGYSVFQFRRAQEGNYRAYPRLSNNVLRLFLALRCAQAAWRGTFRPH
jgi:hypothetical protein